MIKGYIYKTTCWLDGRIYIGQRRGIFNTKYFGSGKHLKLAIAKYGIENFSVEFIQYANTQNELDTLEKCCIATVKSILSEDQVFNISEGGLKGIILRGKNHPYYGIKRLGSKNYNWRGGVCSIKGKCIDCGIEITRGFERCKSCVGKLRPHIKFIDMVKKRGAPWNKGLTKKEYQLKGQTQHGIPANA